MEPSARPSHSVVRFGAFALDLSSGELFKRGHRTRLQDQPFQVLACLLERPGEIVTRDELRHRLWPSETFVGFDEGLNSAIRRLRFALGDSAEHPRFIETFPRRGYRFIAKLEEPTELPVTASNGHPAPPAPVAVPSPAPVTAPGSSAATAARPRLAPRLAALGVVLGLVLLTLILVALNRAALREPRARSPARIDATFTQLTTASGPEWNPALSPAGDFVAYVASPRGNEDVYLQAVGSNAPVDLTADSASDDRQPAFSPDGKQIAFRSERDGGGVFAIDLGRRGVRRLAPFGYDPAWSPDGREIVVATEGVYDPLNRRSTSNLWRIDLRNGQRRRLTSEDSVQPAWSPHGQRIAFWHVWHNGGQRDIATVAADGGKPVPLTDDPAADWSPAWSPDGRYLFFASDRGGSMNLWRVAVDEQSGKPLGEPEAVTAPSRWSGDLSVGARGHGVAFTATEPHSNIERIALDVAHGKLVGEPAAVTAITIPFVQPDVSRDGQWLAFRTELEHEDLYVSRTDGSGLRRLTDDAARDRAASWSPDGNRIAFYSDRSGKYEIWTVAPDGSGLEQLTDVAGDWVSYPVWSADGSRMLVNNKDGTYLFDVPPRGQRVTVLQRLPNPPDGTYVVRGLAWSPDGKRVAGFRYHRDGERLPGLAIYAMDSERYTLIASQAVWVHWLHDSRHLLFSNGGTFYVGDAVSGEVRTVGSLAGEISAFTVAADDKTIYLSRSPDESDIWLLTLH